MIKGSSLGAFFKQGTGKVDRFILLSCLIISSIILVFIFGICGFLGGIYGVGVGVGVGVLEEAGVCLFFGYVAAEVEESVGADEFLKDGLHFGRAEDVWGVGAFDEGGG